jgi:phosphatidate cytidylyltransferase
VLKQRLLTIAVLLPLFVWALFALPTRHFSLLLAVIVLIGAYEWAALMRFPRSWRPAFVLAVAAAMPLGLWIASVPELRFALFVAASAWWVYALTTILRFQNNDSAPGWLTADTGSGALQRAVAGIVVLVPAWIAVTLMHATPFIGGGLVLAFMLLVWGADSGAYVAGRTFGRDKLASRVSPGKTWQGVWGALLAGGLVAGGTAIWLGRTDMVALGGLMVLGLATVLISIVGDLFESLVKRIAGVKDSGRILPGHGGVLDRIDSVTAAAPVFAFGLAAQGVMM